MILIRPGLRHSIAALVREAAAAHRYGVVTDSRVAPLYGEAIAHALDATLVVIPEGESNKTRDSWALATDTFLAAGLGRDSTIVAVGGGVITDLAGFVAATYMRGVPVVHVPTTLLAMIDATIGGKTGVDTPAGKNLVGAFHRPAAVLMDPQVLATLALRDLRAGFAEALKHGAVADEAYFFWLEESLAGQFDETSKGDARPGDGALGRLIDDSVRIKGRIVDRDELEQGARKILNFGHTVGHAIEHLSGYTLRHGEAVAVGMVLVARAGEAAGITETGTADRLAAVLSRAGLPVTRPAGPSADDLLDAMRGDKKSRAGSIEYAIPVRIGTMAGADAGYTVALDDRVVRSVFESSATR